MWFFVETSNRHQFYKKAPDLITHSLYYTKYGQFFQDMIPMTDFVNRDCSLFMIFIEVFRGID